MPFVDVPGAQLFVEVSGDGPACLWLHDLNDAGDGWSAAIAMLPGRRHLALDQRAHGLSVPPASPPEVPFD